MIYEKLQKSRVELQNLKLKKSGKNNYAGFEKILFWYIILMNAKIKDLLFNNNLYVY